LLTRDKKPWTKADSEHLHRGIEAVAGVIHHPDMRSGELERRIFCSIFNVKWDSYVVELSEEVIEEVPKLFWKLSCEVATDDQFDFIPKSSAHTTRAILCRDHSWRYYDVGPPPFFDQLYFSEHPNDNHRLQEWINNTENKVDLMKQENWKALLMHGFLSYDSRIHIAQCILPQDKWITDDSIVAFPDTTISQINDFLPPKKLTNFMISDFIERCMMTNQGQVKLVNSLTYETFFKSEKYRQNCFEEKDNYSLYLCVIQVENHHWVIVEIENPQKQNQKIVLSIADGCRPQHKFPMNLASQKFFLYYAAVMFSDEYANKFTGLGDKVLCESLAQPELYLSTFQLQHASYVLRQINSYDCGVLCIMRMALTIVCKKFGLCLNEVVMPEPRIYRFKIIEIILRCDGIRDILEPDALSLPPVELLSFVGADGSTRFNFVTVSLFHHNDKSTQRIS
jgi:hypothetical protein